MPSFNFAALAATQPYQLTTQSPDYGVATTSLVRVPIPCPCQSCGMTLAVTSFYDPIEAPCPDDMNLGIVVHHVEDTIRLHAAHKRAIACFLTQGASDGCDGSSVVDLRAETKGGGDG